MKMNPRELELIALEHILARYRMTGVLPTIGGQPFDLNQFKQHISAGVDTDTDINVNIDTVKNEIVDCDEHHSADNNSTVETSPTVENTQTAEPVAESVPVQESAAPAAPDPEPETSAVPTPEESTNQNQSTVAGKLFQFFNKG